MTDITLYTTDGPLAEVYREALSEHPNAAELRDPFGKVLDQTREGIQSLAARISVHDAFIREHYHERLSRLANNYLDKIEATYSYNLSYEFYTHLALALSCDTVREVVPVLRILSAEGLQILTRPKKGGESSTKTWIFLPRGMSAIDSSRAPRLHLNVTAKKCEQVQVGTKEVPIYETRCAWGDEIPEIEGAK